MTALFVAICPLIDRRYGLKHRRYSGFKWIVRGEALTSPRDPSSDLRQLPVRLQRAVPTHPETAGRSRLPSTERQVLEIRAAGCVPEALLALFIAPHLRFATLSLAFLISSSPLLQNRRCGNEGGCDFRQLLFERPAGSVAPGLAECRMKARLDR